MKKVFPAVMLIWAALCLSCPLLKGDSQDNNAARVSNCIEADSLTEPLTVVRVAQIDSFIRKVQSDWAIPGLSVTVIKGGTTVLSKGYGVKAKGGQERVDSATVFQIGSASKAFTATLMSTLVDDNLVSWEDRVADILPDWHPVDSLLRKELRVKDLMSHQTGFGGQVFTYFPNFGFDSDDIYSIIQLTRPEHRLRSGLHYNNMVFLIAAKIIEAKTGKAFADVLQERIFDPLGMSSGCYGSKAFLASDNRCMQHSFYRRNNRPCSSLLKGESRALHWLDVVGPAGGISCSSGDLAKWAEFHRLEGIVPTISTTSTIIPGSPLVSRGQMSYLHTGVVKVRQTEETLRQYAQGWYVEDGPQYNIIYHTGTTWGHTALCYIVPQLELSVAILCSSEVNQCARFAIARFITDLYRGVPAVDYSAEGLQEWLEHRRSSSTKSGFTIPYSTQVHSPGELVGYYSKPAPFGNVVITLEQDGKLYITHGPHAWKHPLHHSKDNMYHFDSDGHHFPVRFNILPDGRADSFEIDWGCGEKTGPWVRQQAAPAAGPSVSCL